MHQTNIIITLTGALSAALFMGYITNFFKLSPIVGYLLAGIIIGPFTPGFVADQNIASQLAEIGVMLLLFGVGLNFHFSELLAVRRIAIPGAVAQIMVATILGAVVADSFGYSWQTGIVFGLSLSVASTAVLVRILVDNKALHTPTGHAAVGWLVVEDLFTVIVLVLLPVVFSHQSSGTQLVSVLCLTILKMTGLVVVVVVMGKKVIPWFFTHIAESASRELFTLTVLVTALGIAVVSALVFDVSMALGAFLAGMVVGGSEFSLRATCEAIPLRDAFAVLFFVAVGMLLDPAIFYEDPMLVLGTLAVVVIGKGLTAFAIVTVLGYPLKMALGVAVALAQIGEFSFILATLGEQIGILDNITKNALVATAIISITINPMLYRCIPAIDKWIEKKKRLSRILAIRTGDMSKGAMFSPMNQPTTLSDHVVIIGYGPTGRTITRLLRENNIQSTTIELNLDTSRRLTQSGIKVIYGDATKRETLEKAAIAKARSLVISTTSMTAPQEVAKLAKEINHEIKIIAGTNSIRDLLELRRIGLRHVFAGEGEVALAILETMLKDLGATEEQIQRERTRFHNELLETPTKL